MSKDERIARNGKILAVLLDPRYRKQADTVIAAFFGAAPSTVGRLRKLVGGPDVRIGRNGRAVDTSKLPGRPRKAAQVPQQIEGAAV